VLNDKSFDRWRSFSDWLYQAIETVVDGPYRLRVYLCRLLHCPDCEFRKSQILELRKSNLYWMQNRPRLRAFSEEGNKRFIQDEKAAKISEE
jgi:hypothetical protein